MKRIQQVAIIGPNADTCTTAQYELGLDLGKSLAEVHKIIICGGKGGIMEAVCKGAHTAYNYRFGSTVGILPEYDKQLANPYCDIVIPSGIGYARNSLVVSAGDIVIAIGGGVGTLTEIAFAWHYQKPIIGVTGYQGWSEKLAGHALDNRREDRILPAKSTQEIMDILQSLEHQ